jgi:hypothetical protein
LKLIFEKRLSWKGRLPGRTDYNALLLDADEVTALVRADAVQLKNLRFCDVQGAVSGISERSVQPLIDLGEFEEVEEFSPNARRAIRVVTTQSVSAFRLKYVTAGEICQTRGLHHKQVKYRLLAAGVELVGGFAPNICHSGRANRLPEPVTRQYAWWRPLIIRF